MTDPTETARALALPPAADRAAARKGPLTLATPCAAFAVEDRAALRDRIAAAIRGLNEQEGGGVLADLDEDADVLALADETADAETHTCDNCEGVSPDTCFNNSHRPPEQCPRTETARAVLHRHGLPEDVTARALALHAQELAATRTAALEEAADAVEADSWSRRDRWGRYEDEGREAGMRAAAALLRRLAAEAGGPRTVAQPDEAAPTVSCSLAFLRGGHGPHAWEPQPGMRPVHCPGVAAAPEPETSAAPETTSWAGATEVPTEREIAERAASGLVGYRQGRGTLLHCLAHKPVPASRWADFHEVTADELDDGGICVHPRCGRDLLAPWPAAPETEARHCGKTKGVSGIYYRPCDRPAGHPEAYCQSADGKHLFLPAPETEARPWPQTT
ncbi:MULTISPECIES: hypothetical protein [Streptomyces]|uniref:Uncharacterized protein n=1 Tax=Streptomyces doudnae TaxID=3075536 RepID=A0ABD5EPP3_9ACTN|nr:MULTISPECIES: hypothetical protein [unclassified Streptomyces]MDT0435669.1 hypothetical protein [Streptomyces sp. DSM 41981]MYQ62623.1 hypothetical protein [Streptomyces sp. SID4950]SCD40966.1 hypothetical protein GA0115242_1048129 [Streptomyces sp. SolWspMP-5a-2]